jgi:16S rRNA (cytosine967-C5)-methyltransferase
MTAREYALVKLDAKTLPFWKPQLVRDPRPAPPTDPRDRALAEQIITGTVKNLLLLFHHIEHYSGKSLAGIDPLVQKILAIALYQIKFLDRIPASAAVDQAVEQTKHFGRRRASGFVNAVLRNVDRKPPPPIPDPITDPEKYAEQVLSHPRELFHRLKSLLGPERALEFCRHSNTEPPTILRLFEGIQREALIEESSRHPDHPPFELSPHEFRGMLILRSQRSAPILARWAALGLAQAQDPTSAAVVPQMRITLGLRILDRCAGLGTKTLQIHDLAGPTAEIIAMDSSAHRIARLRESHSRRGITSIRPVIASSLSNDQSEIPGFFSRILIDVPCSNSGVLARRPEARYRDQVDCLVKIQAKILDDTIPRLMPGGILVYSTCSVWPEENELQVRDFLSRNPGLELVEERLTLPSFDETAPQKYHDGGYFAVLASPSVPMVAGKSGL